MHSYYRISALITIASTNSIPMLVDVYTKLLETNKDENQEKQKEIIDILLNFETNEVLDIVFNLLDLSDKKYINHSPYQKRFNITLRESVWQDMLKPKPAMTLKEQKKRTERAEQWQEKLFKNKNSKLSDNNELFMEKARNLIRPAEERNLNAEISLP